MSYARFGCDDSDVYVFLASDSHKLECCGCSLSAARKFTAPTTDEFLQHLTEHMLAGHCVPSDTIAELRADAPENDKWMAGFP